MRQRCLTKVYAYPKGKEASSALLGIYRTKSGFNEVLFANVWLRFFFGSFSTFILATPIDFLRFYSKNKQPKWGNRNRRKMTKV